MRYLCSMNLKFIACLTASTTSAISPDALLLSFAST